MLLLTPRKCLTRNEDELTFHRTEDDKLNCSKRKVAVIFRSDSLLLRAAITLQTILKVAIIFKGDIKIFNDRTMNVTTLSSLQTRSSMQL